MTDSDILELNRLAYRYAAAVDSRDVDAFLAVFAPDGRMRSYHPGDEEPFADTRYDSSRRSPRRWARCSGSPSTR